MLVKVVVENFKSFDKQVELSMISSAKIQTNKNHKVKIKQTSILKHAVVYGANASGKSNLVSVFGFMKSVLLNGLPINCSDLFCRSSEDNRNKDSVFELQFTVGDKFYAYGFSVLLSQRKITEEWLYELNQDGTAHNLFERKGSEEPIWGSSVTLTGSDKDRFAVYAKDFAGHDSNLFLTEMNRGKRYDKTSKLIFSQQVFSWLINNVIIINPQVGISNTNIFLNHESLQEISNLVQTFDTGITEIKTKVISVDEMSKMVPPEILSSMIASLKQQVQMTNIPNLQMTCRFENGFFNISLNENEEPEITTLVLKHGKSLFDFNFAEESDGTKRLFDLIDMLMTERYDTVFVIDELERSLHPKLTEQFLKLFMHAHADSKMQLIFTTHEDTIMDQELFRRDEIWFVERDYNNASNIYSLNRFKERYDKKLSKAYLDGRYGAIPVFRNFSFSKEE